MRDLMHPLVLGHLSPMCRHFKQQHCLGATPIDTVDPLTKHAIHLTTAIQQQWPYPFSSLR